MKIRAWACEALTGNVLGELLLSGSGTFENRFGGGLFNAMVSLSHLTVRDNSRPDFVAIERILNWLTVGRRTILLTAGSSVLGEWILMERSRVSTSGEVQISGMEWAGYPALRSINSDFKYANTEQMVIARAAWNQAFLSFNGAMTITIPTSGSTGVTRDMEHFSHEVYYSDVLDELTNAEDGFEWYVDVSATFSGGVPTKANRQIVWGHPTLSRAPALPLHQAAPGGRQGNIVELSGGEDFRRYAQSVYGIGDGEGERQPWVGLSDPTGTNAGNLNKTMNVDFPGVQKISTLTKLAQGELDRAQDLRDPYEVTVFADKVATLPRVGYQATLRVDPTYVFPSGLSETLRVGQVTYPTEGSRCPTIRLLAA